jgi:putative membrane protein
MKTYFFTYLKGMAMGAADVVPGVSGGTIAFISGIYERLIKAIKSINFSALNTLFKQGIGAAWQQIDGTFLLSLFLGILTSVLSLAKGISWALDAYPQMLWSFFFGLVLASTVFVAQDISREAKKQNINAWTFGTITSFLIGAAIAYGITLLSPAAAPLTGGGLDYLIFFGAGAIAICAMILPGISGSFILLLMGMYPVVLEAATKFKVDVLAVFMLGCLIGLLLFSHVLSWLFTHFRAVAMAVLTGFMLGSLNKVWPWQNVLQTRMNSKGEEVPFLYKNVMPSDYAAEPYILYCIILVVFGFLVVFGIEKLSRAAKNEEVL